jgi:hypothetical protein
MDECGSTAYGSADRFRLSQITAYVEHGVAEPLSDADETENVFNPHE